MLSFAPLPLVPLIEMPLRAVTIQSKGVDRFLGVYWTFLPLEKNKRERTRLPFGPGRPSQPSQLAHHPPPLPRPRACRPHTHLSIAGPVANAVERPRRHVPDARRQAMNHHASDRDVGCPSTSQPKPSPPHLSVGRHLRFAVVRDPLTLNYHP